MTAFPNYVRTLLLNEERGSYGPDFFGEEYVPATFRPRPLPIALRKVRGALFGGAPDRQMLNFRLFQLMQVLHSTQLEQDVTLVDDRITYLPLDRPALYSRAYPPVVSPEAGTSGELTVLGDLDPDEKAGQIHYWWHVNVIDGTYVNVRNLLPPVTDQVYSYVKTAGLSQLIPLTGSSLFFNFTGGPDSAWYVEAVAKPERNLADITTTLDTILTQSDVDVIFGVSSPEPWKTWRSLWLLNDQLEYKLGGLLLAVANRTATYKEIATAVPEPVPPTPPTPPTPSSSLPSLSSVSLPSLSSEAPPVPPSSSSLPSSSLPSSSEVPPEPVPSSSLSSLSSESSASPLPPVTANLEAWFDGQDASTLTVVGSNISQWDDKSGLGNHITQATGADQPTVSTLNSYAAVAFDGTGQHLDGVSWSQQSPTTLFVVYQFSSPIKGGTAAMVWSANSDRIRWEKRTTGNLRRIHENSDLIGTLEDTNAHYFTGIYNDVSSAIRIDGAVDVSGNVGTRTPSSDGLSIGATPGGLSGHQGVIGEVLWYDALLNATEISQVEAWLKNKWGL
jgi:hypothetical protein